MENKRARKEKAIYLIGKYSGFNFVLKIINNKKLADFIFDSALPFVVGTIIFISFILVILISLAQM